MKLVGGFLAGALLSFGLVANGATYKLDSSKSKVMWSGSKVVGGAHDGTLDVAGGTITFEKGAFKSASVDVDMKTIKNNDIKNPEFNKKLVDHLNSDDFFSVSKFPTSKFVMSKAQKVKGDTYRIWGKMTIKGITKDVDFVGKFNESGKSLKGSGEIKLDRTDFNVRYGSGKFFENLGDKMISDEIVLKFDIHAMK